MKNSSGTNVKNEAATYTLYFKEDACKVEEIIDRFVSRRTFAELTLEIVTRFQSRYFIYDGLFEKNAFAIEVNVFYSDNGTKVTLYAFERGEIPDELINTRLAVITNVKLRFANSLHVSHKLQNYMRKKLTEIDENQFFPKQ